MSSPPPLPSSSTPKPHHTQPLHNFSLPSFSSFTKTPNTNSRRSRNIKLNGDSEAPYHKLQNEVRQVMENDSDTDSINTRYVKLAKLEKDGGCINGVVEGDGEGEKQHRRIVFKLKTPTKRKGETSGAVEEEEKPWKLRERKTGGGGGGESGKKVEGKKEDVLPVKKRQFVGDDEEEKKKVIKFTASLSRYEVEEDVYGLTGSKPRRRPKKRPNIVQKQVDNVFPGLWLDMISADSYKVVDVPTKKQPL